MIKDNIHDKNENRNWITGKRELIFKKWGNVTCNTMANTLKMESEKIKCKLPKLVQ